MKKKLSYWKKLRDNSPLVGGATYGPDTDATIYQLYFVDVWDEGEPIIIEADDDTKGEEVPPADLVDDAAKKAYLRKKPKKPKL